jgi:hypothetical protein
VFSVGQVAAVRAAFALAGYEGDLVTMPIASEDERLFVLPHADVLRLSDVRLVEQIATQVLGRKVWVVASIDEDTIPFG